MKRKDIPALVVTPPEACATEAQREEERPIDSQAAFEGWAAVGLAARCGAGELLKAMSFSL
jgi:hypothetical protein